MAYALMSTIIFVLDYVSIGNYLVTFKILLTKTERQFMNKAYETCNENENV